MSYIEKLLLISSDPLAARPVRLPKILQSYPLGQELFEMLQRKNGFLLSNQHYTCYLSQRMRRMGSRAGMQTRCGGENTRIYPMVYFFC